MHAGLVQLALVYAGFNLATAATQFFGWRRLVKARVDFSFLFFHRRSAIQLAKYGSVMSIWTLAMFFVSGLDIVIVGHYQYKDTGFYADCQRRSQFHADVVASVFGPLVPAVSSMQAGTNAGPDWRYLHQNDALLRVAALPSRSATGVWRLSFAQLMGWKALCHTERFLSRSAGFGQCGSTACLPYILIVVATGKQHLATIAAIAEAVVNIVVSIWLVQRIGAVGVAAGTLVGAFVSFSVHLLVSMRLTPSQPSWFHAGAFLVQGVLRPLLIIVPSFFLYPFWRKLNMLPAPPAVLALWIVATAAIAWWVGLTAEDRQTGGVCCAGCYTGGGSKPDSLSFLGEQMGSLRPSAALGILASRRS
jgi:hypothetical protein